LYRNSRKTKAYYVTSGGLSVRTYQRGSTRNFRDVILVTATDIRVENPNFVKIGRIT
jgi:hypothetical protein